MSMGANINPKSQLSSLLRAALANRRVILMIGIVAVAVGLYMKRDWLITAGVAPVIVGLLPCAAMCALGLCMGGKKGGGDGGNQKNDADH
ncbi:MAG: hypothetical protein E6Q98_01525 [Rhodospirillaceae bacterium]|nr:MAG: hypothetical protein E6Q98_01525 [Rhodospirillaceae bacterium]